MSEKPRILIVEDERLVAEDLAELLTQAGYEIAGVAQAGMEAVDIATQAHPDLVLMDVVLEGSMDGIEAANLIQSHRDIPIVYLTAFADRDVLQRAKASQPFGYLVKPFSEKELIAVIEMALNKHELEIMGEIGKYEKLHSTSIPAY